MFVNPLLGRLHAANIGLRIGSVYCGTPTCADDVLLLSDSSVDLQAMLYTVQEYAKAEQYSISDTKTKTMVFNSKMNPEDYSKTQIWEINDKPVQTASEYTHIGIDRAHTKNGTSNEIVQKRISTARQTAYALMGAGLHGLNGVNPTTSIKLWTIYILPRLLYGLEITKLSRADITRLETYQRQFLKQIMHLPVRTSTEGVYILSGRLPIEMELDKKQLTLFGNIIRFDCVERDLATRQLAIKDKSSHSWFRHITELLKVYNLPQAADLLDSRISKIQWKNIVSKKVEIYWANKIITEAKSKTTLKFLRVEGFKYNRVHQMWKFVRTEPTAVTRACVKAKLLLGVYTLQANRSRFNQYEVEATCPLCNSGNEDRVHFLAQCEALNSVRLPFTEKLKECLRLHGGSALDQSDSGLTAFVNIILDCNYASVLPDSPSTETCSTIENITSGLCYALHQRRQCLLMKE